MKRSYQKFSDEVMKYYREHGRHHLPWRKNITPYRIVVSEMMLQQTQVERVIPFFKNWMEHFPNWKQLAHAPQSEVLKHWKGLGYNSRALRLHKLAQIVSKEYKGGLPDDYQVLLKLPGIGPYTAGAVMAFAFNSYVPLIETNVRRVFIHHFFADSSDISDAEILAVMNKMGHIESPRIWYSALMDYGTTLPKVLKSNPNTKSKHYTKQSTFKGSDREIRGKILDFLLKTDSHRITKTSLYRKLGNEINRYQKVIEQLEQEGFIQQTNNAVILR